MSHLLGVLGENISYSLSPRIFDWAFRETGIEGEYRIFDVSHETVRPFLQQNASWHGLSITTPYKELAFATCDRLSATAQATSAVNVVTRTDDGLRGDNTDVAGFQFALNSLLKDSPAAELILVIGSCGAARAALSGLGELFPGARVEVATRRPEEAKRQLNNLMKIFRSSNVIELQTAAHFLRDFDLIIQATPVGSAKQPGVPLPERLTFREGAAVLEMIYAPHQTPFLKRAEECGARTQNGLIMLIAQAAAAFQIWTGKEFPLEKAMHELLPELNAA